MFSLVNACADRRPDRAVVRSGPGSWGGREGLPRGVPAPVLQPLGRMPVRPPAPVRACKGVWPGSAISTFCIRMMQPLAPRVVNVHSGADPPVFLRHRHPALVPRLLEVGGSISKPYTGKPRDAPGPGPRESPQPISRASPGPPRPGLTTTHPDPVPPLSLPGGAGQGRERSGRPRCSGRSAAQAGPGGAGEGVGAKRTPRQFPRSGNPFTPE